MSTLKANGNDNTNSHRLHRVTLSIIVHDDFSHIRRALHSILSASACSYVIYLTINAGKAADIAAITHEFSDAVIIVNDTPKGFAENHNHILKLAKTDYIFLLNDDIEAAPYMIDSLIHYMEMHQEVGLISPRVLNPDGTPQLMAFSDPSLIRMLYRVSGLGHFTRQGSVIRTWIMHSPLKRFLKTASLQTYTETQFVPVVVGVVMGVRQIAYQQAGGMDEDTRVYGEEYGWHWRLRQHRWEVALYADTFVTHFNIEQPLHGWKLSEHRKGMLNYFIRYRPTWQALVLRGGIFIFHSIRAFLVLFVNRQQAFAEWKTALTAITFQPKQS